MCALTLVVTFGIYCTSIQVYNFMPCRITLYCMTYYDISVLSHSNCLEYTVYMYIFILVYTCILYNCTSVFVSWHALSPHWHFASWADTVFKPIRPNYLANTDQRNQKYKKTNTIPRSKMKIDYTWYLTFYLNFLESVFKKNWDLCQDQNWNLVWKNIAFLQIPSLSRRWS